ncbi:MAG: methyltransferase, TrmH family [Acidobacteriota bacterium]|jgi:TrmH family RNA methyltransferase|nr:methyltransferase, TrmH family [Acidobacteriota bacterium]
MSELVITSRDNSLAKHARAVRAGKIREQIFIEGLRLCEEAAQALSAGDILNIICTESFAEDRRGASLLEALMRDGQRATIVSEAVFASISDTKTPQGIILLASRPSTQRSDLLKSLDKIRLLVILHKINNPSNAGAILRTAEAAGAWGIILTEGTTDIFSPKALRGAMGSSFRLPLWTGASFDEALSFCREHGIRTVCADLRAGRTHTEIDWTVPSALIVGPEAAGLENAEIALADESLRIPMQAPVESLNVAVATGIVLYEAARQRAVGSRQ